MTVHKDVIKKLEEVLEIVKPLPQGYQYKVRELCACIETVVGMHDDIQRGIIPEIFQSKEEIPEESQEIIDNVPENLDNKNTSTKLDIGDFEL